MTEPTVSNICKTCGSDGGELKLTLLQKLGRRIHNQRMALRDNWMITERRHYYHHTRPLQSRYLAHVIKLLRRIKNLEKLLQIAREGLHQIEGMGSRDDDEFSKTAQQYLDRLAEENPDFNTAPSTLTTEQLRQHLLKRSEEDAGNMVGYMFIHPQDLFRVLSE